MEGSHATSRGEDTGLPPLAGFRDIKYHMLFEDYACAIHLLQLSSPAPRDPTQSLDRFAHVGDHSQSEQPPSTLTREEAILATHVIEDVHVVAAAAAAARDQQVADFVANTGVVAHAAAISTSAFEEEAAHATQTAAGEAFIAAMATIAEAEAATSSAT